MADNPKPETNISPAPTEVAGPPPSTAQATPPSPSASGDKPSAASDKPAPTSGPQAEPLSDGTVPTILSQGDAHKSIAKGKTSLASVYRKADIVSTLLTFGGAVLAAVLILGGYAYFTKPKAPTSTALPKITSLSSADLSKLNNFFSGNSAGNSSQVLTVSSSSLFNGRVAVNSDLKVVGGVDVSGTSTLANLSVTANSTLGVTSIRGTLNVAGPVNLQSPTVLGGGATVTGNVTASGNGSFGGSLSAGIVNAASISVTTINLAGHINIAGQTPSVTPNSEAGAGASASVSGNDTTGTVTVTTGAVAPSDCDNGQGGVGLLAAVNFKTVYPNTPRVLITPVGAETGLVRYYVLPSANNFSIGAACDMQSHTTYTWDYWVVQ